MPEREKILPQFQEFLIAKKIVPEKYVSFYAYWVSRFLAFSNRNEDMYPDQKVCHFLEGLRKDKTVADWQAQQAETAIKVYVNNYLEGDISILYGAVKEDKHKAGLTLIREYKDIAGKMRDALRLRHYAYRTEQSYLDWVRQFYRYMEGA